MPFQSTLPARGATAATAAPSSLLPFQSTLPARGATVKQAMVLAYSDEFQSTLPARGATHLPLLAPPAWNISIHAPRTGSDARQPGHSGGLRYFNPRSPHGERHCAPFMDMGKSVISIHAPRTGSDADLDGHLPSGGDFNPRSPHGERLTGRTAGRSPEKISIHAPRTGSDGDGRAAERAGVRFQSTLPARGATRATCG